MAVYSGHRGAIYVQSGAPQTLTNGATTANAARTQYQITDASKRFLTRTGTVTVETSPDGVTWTPAVEGTDYALQRLGGIVTFASARPVGTQVRVSGDYWGMVELGQVEEWSLEVSREVHTYVTMRQEYLGKAYGAGDSKGSFGRLWLDGDLFSRLSAGSEIALVLYVSYDDNLAYALYGLLANLKIESPGDGLVTESVDFEGMGTPYYGITI